MDEPVLYRRIPGVVIRPERYYICRRWPPVCIVDQPRFGFSSAEEAMDWLAGRLVVTQLELFIAVPSNRIQL